MTAANFQAGRGDTIQTVLASELSYYDDAFAVMSGIEQLVAYIAGTQVLIETTAKGAGTVAHQFWRGACEGDNPYKAIFLAWQDDPQNRIPDFNTELEKKVFVEEMFGEYPEMKDRMEHYKLSLEQIGFYYRILKYKCYGDELFMMQEYPCDAEEAWLATGTPIFPIRIVGDYRLRTQSGCLYNPASNDIIKQFKHIDQLEKDQELNREGDSYLEIWRYPIPGRRYLIGADPSAGYLDSDYSSAFIADMQTMEMCGEFHGRIEPHEFAYVLAGMGYTYNNAIIAPEINDVGLAVQALLQQIYWNIYQWKMIDSYSLKPSTRLGWSTSSQTRPMIIANAKRLFRERSRYPETMGQFIQSKALLDELRTFVLDSKGKPGAASGCHDDRVMAWMITLGCCLLENYGMLVDDSSDIPVNVLSQQEAPLIQQARSMEDITDELMSERRGWKPANPSDYF